MAASPAASAPAPAKKGPSLLVQGGLLLGLTAAAAGMGWFGGGTLKLSGAPGASPPAEAQAHAATAEGHGEEGGKGEAAEAAYVPGRPAIVPLPAITTNLAAPTDTWVRAELALQFTDAPPPGMADTIAQDLLAFLRTLKLHQLQGPSAFLHLKADLDERARIRSEGKVAQVFVRALILE